MRNVFLTKFNSACVNKHQQRGVVPQHTRIYAYGPGARNLRSPIHNQTHITGKVLILSRGRTVPYVGSSTANPGCGTFPRLTSVQSNQALLGARQLRKIQSSQANMRKWPAWLCNDAVPCARTTARVRTREGVLHIERHDLALVTYMPATHKTPKRLANSCPTST